MANTSCLVTGAQARLPVMPRLPVLLGRLAQFERPNWDPLLDLVGDELVRWFMWMNQVELADGTAVHAYKHVGTRRYLHLAEDGRAFGYERPDRYRELRAGAALEAAFGGWDELWPEPD